MERPQNVAEVRRFMGMANQLGKYSPRLAEMSQPLRQLLSTRRLWVWEHPQEQAFTLIKEELTRPTVLELYNPQRKVKISADASSHGLGAVLLQESGNKWKPVAYASRSMSDTEKRYAQIEKEALSLTWACEKFQDYILGRKFHIETDHKTLVPLLSSKLLDMLPPRIVRFRLRMARYDYTIEHVQYLENCFTPLTHCQEHTCKDRSRKIPFRTKWKPSSTTSSLPYQLLRTDYRCTEKHKLATPRAPKYWNSASRSGLTNALRKRLLFPFGEQDRRWHRTLQTESKHLRLVAGNNQTDMPVGAAMPYMYTRESTRN